MQSSSNTIQNVFALGHIFEKHPQSFTKIIITIGTIDNAFFPAAFPDGASGTEIRYSPLYRKAAVTDNAVRGKIHAYHFSPLFGDFFTHFIVVFLRGDIGTAVRANQSAISNHLFHSCLIL
jgi:hypothetical protein